MAKVAGRAARRRRRPRAGAAAREPRVLQRALLVSLLVHVLLLSLSFGNDEFGLPGLTVPWRERRGEVPELRVVVQGAPSQDAAGVSTPLDRQAQAAPAASAVFAAPAAPAVFAATPDAAAPPDVQLASHGAPSEPGPAHVPAAVLAEPAPRVQAGLGPALALAASPPLMPIDTQTSEPATPALGVMPLEPRAALMAAPPMIAMDKLDRAPLAVPPVVPVPSASTLPPLAAASSVAGAASAVAAAVAAHEAAAAPAARAAQDSASREAARAQAQRQAAERQEALRHEAERQEALRQEAAKREAVAARATRAEAARTEAAKAEASRAEAERAEAERAEAARAEAARAEAARAETARIEAARQDAARAEAARAEAARAEAARAEAARTEAARQEAARREAARLLAAQDDERREAARRAIGRQLDEEAAKRAAAAQAARPPDGLPSSWSSPRRARLFGRIDPNAELVLYGEAWARKIQLNTPADAFAEAARQPHKQALVTVAIRRDGSLESITFVLSSGVPELDEAIRRIVQRHLPYQAFPPALAHEYDVVEIRRSWHFDMAVRLH